MFAEITSCLIELSLTVSLASWKLESYTANRCAFDMIKKERLHVLLSDSFFSTQLVFQILRSSGPQDTVRAQ